MLKQTAVMMFAALMAAGAAACEHNSATREGTDSANNPAADQGPGHGTTERGEGTADTGTMGSSPAGASTMGTGTMGTGGTTGGSANDSAAGGTTNTAPGRGGAGGAGGMGGAGVVTIRAGGGAR